MESDDRQVEYMEACKKAVSKFDAAVKEYVGTILKTVNDDEFKKQLEQTAGALYVVTLSTLGHMAYLKWIKDKTDEEPKS